MLTLQERTLQALAAGFTQSELAGAAEVSPSAVSQWKSGEIKSLKAASAEGLAAKTGWNVKWWAKGIGPRENTPPQAQGMSVDIPIVGPRGPDELEWRKLEMTRKNDVPSVFRTFVPDGAMGKKWPKGLPIVCDRANDAPDGWMVVVRVNGEGAYLRRYKRVDDGWIASPDDPDFRVFRSWEVELEIIAKVRYAEVPPNEM